MALTLWHDLEFQHLRYAIAVREQHGFTQAASVLDIDQGFLSKQIRSLERKLGFQLFDRKTRPLSVTAAGATFLDEAQHILMRTQNTIKQAKDVEAGQWGTLNVGVNTSISNSQLPAILQATYQQFPHITVVLHELASYDQIVHLENRQIDIGFFHRHNLNGLSEDKLAALGIMPILSEPLVVVLPQHHRLAKQQTISLTQLHGERFVLPQPGLLHGLRDCIDLLLTQMNCEPVIVQEAAWMTTVLNLVAGNMGVSLLPANARNLQRVGVVYCDIEEVSPLLEIVAVYEPSNALATLQRFIEVLDA